MEAISQEVDILKDALEKKFYDAKKLHFHLKSLHKVDQVNRRIKK